ncbi:MAG: DUF433 domain-containing protein [Pseudanabaena sp.]|jgi:uncharacterized protein (DUF433 family)
MLTTSHTYVLPLSTNSHGTILVGNTRVTLDTVIFSFNQGATSEEIASRYPSLKLSDVYSTIAFYLDHQQEVEEYLQQRQQKALEVRKQNELRFDTQGLRDRLLARQAAKHPC